MKKIFAVLVACLLLTSVNAQTATNFTVDDCNGVSHDLFAELNSGSVVVICWVMPCASCIAPAATCATTVQSYASSHPGKVKYYMVDDYANTNCATLASWAGNNAITADAFFSNAAITMSDYGTDGMPKTVVIGGWQHTVYLNENNTLAAGDLQDAIDAALLATHTDELLPENASTNIFPNPTFDGIVSINLLSFQSPDLRAEIYNAVGSLVKTVSLATSSSDNATVDLSSLGDGLYLIRLSDGNAVATTARVIKTR